MVLVANPSRQRPVALGTREAIHIKEAIAPCRLLHLSISLFCIDRIALICSISHSFAILKPSHSFLDITIIDQNQIHGKKKKGPHNSIPYSIHEEEATNPQIRIQQQAKMHSKAALPILAASGAVAGGSGPEHGGPDGGGNAVVDAFVTYVAQPTTFTFQEKCYTATTPGDVTVTNCPCTVQTVCISPSWGVQRWILLYPVIYGYQARSIVY